MPDEYLYLDVIPLRTSEEVGGFSLRALRARGVAVAGTLSSSGEFQQFHSGDCGKLVEHLGSARCVVGYNILDFDYELIRGQVPFRRPKTLDLMVQLSEAAGWPVSLREAVRATLGKVGLADGNSLTQAWREGERERVYRALKRKLNVVRRLHEYTLAHDAAIMLNGRQEGGTE